MWISKRITDKWFKNERASCGRVSSTGKENISIKTERPCASLPIVAPYGIAYVPAQGSESVVLPVNGGEVCVGTIMQGKELSAGEIMLFSAGGATLVLKNDGKILANGKEL